MKKNVFGISPLRLVMNPNFSDPTGCGSEFERIMEDRLKNYPCPHKEVVECGMEWRPTCGGWPLHTPS